MGFPPLHVDGRYGPPALHLFSAKAQRVALHTALTGTNGAGFRAPRASESPHITSDRAFNPTCGDSRDLAAAKRHRPRGSSLPSWQLRLLTATCSAGSLTSGATDVEGLPQPQARIEFAAFRQAAGAALGLSMVRSIISSAALPYSRAACASSNWSLILAPAPLRLFDPLGRPTPGCLPPQGIRSPHWLFAHRRQPCCCYGGALSDLAASCLACSFFQ